MNGDSSIPEEGDLECKFKGVGTMGVFCTDSMCRGTRGCTHYDYLLVVLQTVQRKTSSPFHERVEPALIAYGY